MLGRSDHLVHLKTRHAKDSRCYILHTEGSVDHPDRQVHCGGVATRLLYQRILRTCNICRTRYALGLLIHQPGEYKEEETAGDGDLLVQQLHKLDHGKLRQECEEGGKDIKTDVNDGRVLQAGHRLLLAQRHL